MEFRNINFADRDDVFVYSFAIGACFIPSLAILIQLNKADKQILGNLFYYVLAISNIGIFFLVNKNITNNNFNATIERAELANIDNNGIVINAISVSLYGEMLSLVVLAELFLKEKKNYLISLGLIYIGFNNLLLGGSRSPFLGFVIVLIILIVFSLKKLKISSRTGFLYLLLIISLSLVSFIYILPKFDTSNFVVFQRLTEFFGDRKTGQIEARDGLISEAWNMFLDSPFIGKQFVTETGLFYPHNIIIESLMAVGIFGSTFFFLFLFSLLKKTVTLTNHINTNKAIFIVLFSCIFISTLTSGCLFNGNDFWTIAALIVATEN